MFLKHGWAFSKFLDLPYEEKVLSYVSILRKLDAEKEELDKLEKERR